MEKTIKFEDVVALINKAMEDKLSINYESLNKYITITNKSNNKIKIRLVETTNWYNGIKDKETHYIFIKNNTPALESNAVNIEISLKELAAFELLLYEVEEYAQNQIVDYFNHFLDEEVVESPKTIDNIDE